MNNKSSRIFAEATVNANDLPGKGENSGPFQIIHNLESDAPSTASTSPKRDYECNNYDLCLQLAAALNWDSFTCHECNGKISQSLLWRAHQAMRKDSVANKICEQLPEINVFCSAATNSNSFEPSIELNKSSKKEEGVLICNEEIVLHKDNA